MFEGSHHTRSNSSRVTSMRALGLASQMMFRAGKGLSAMACKAFVFEGDRVLPCLKESNLSHFAVGSSEVPVDEVAGESGGSGKTHIPACRHVVVHGHTCVHVTYSISWTSCGCMHSVQSCRVVFFYIRDSACTGIGMRVKRFTHGHGLK